MTMDKRINYMLAAITGAALMTACDDGPKTITTEKQDAGSTGVFSDDASPAQPGKGIAGSSIEENLHTVIAQEVLPTTKYVYVRVKEGDEEFWIASTKQEVVVGKSYFYRGGLMKTNFESKEYNRTFDKLYLISQLVPSDHGNTGAGMPGTGSMAGSEQAPAVHASSEGSVKIAALVADPKKYEGKSIQISGTCTKVNPMIMGRNWIHLKDGSKDDYDLVITTDAVVPEGQAVTMVGTVVLKKDFGAGYNYDILLEGGMVVK